MYHSSGFNHGGRSDHSLHDYRKTVIGPLLHVFVLKNLMQIITVSGHVNPFFRGPQLTRHSSPMLEMGEGVHASSVEGPVAIVRSSGDEEQVLAMSASGRALRSPKMLSRSRFVPLDADADGRFKQMLSLTSEAAASWKG